MDEKHFLNQLLSHLRKIPNSWWYKIPDPTRCGVCGTITRTEKRPFDIVGVCNGNFYAIEVKVGKNKLSPHQDAALRLVEIAGGGSYVVYPDKFYSLINSNERWDSFNDNFIDAVNNRWV